MTTLYDYLMSAELLDVAGTDPVRIIRNDTGEVFELERHRLGLYLIEERISADRAPGWYGFGVYFVRDDGEREIDGRDKMRTLRTTENEEGATK